MTFNFHLRRRSYIFSYASQAELQKNTGHTCVSVAGGIAKFAYCIEYGLHQSSNLRFFCGTFFFPTASSSASPKSLRTTSAGGWMQFITEE